MNDLHAKYKIIGMSKYQIQEILGDNNMFIKDEDGYDVYNYSIGQTLKSNRCFQIYMKNNIVVKFNEYTH